MKKTLAYGLVVGLIAAASLVAAAPAQAAVTATLSPTTDLYAGRLLTLTLVDDGSFCNDDVIGAPGNLWGAMANVIDSNSDIVGTLFFIAYDQHSGTAQTYVMQGSYNWLVDPSTPAEAGDYTTSGFSCATLGGPGSGVDSNTLAFSAKPISLSATTVAAGDSVDVTVYDSANTWCLGANGPGFSMGIGLSSDSADTIYIPAGLGAGSGVKGNGDFVWENESATVPVSIPADTPPGTYTLFAGCISPELDGYQQPGPGMIVQNFVVTAAKLPATGLSADTMGATGLAALGLLALGAGIVVVRRRMTSTR